MILFWLKSAYFTAPIPITFEVFKIKSSFSKRLSLSNLFNRSSFALLTDSDNKSFSFMVSPSLVLSFLPSIPCTNPNGT